MCRKDADAFSVVLRTTWFIEADENVLRCEVTYNKLHNNAFRAIPDQQLSEMPVKQDTAGIGY
jgi:hypothetical protein